MKLHFLSRPILALAFGLSILSLLHAQKGNTPLSLEEIVRGDFHPRSAGMNFKPSEDGACYTTLSKDRKRIVEYRFDTGEKVKTLIDLTTLNLSQEVKEIEDYLIGPGGKDILIFTDVVPIFRRSWCAFAYRYDVRRRRLTPLCTTREMIMIPTFSPDGRMVAFVRNNNIYIAKFDYDSEVAVTTDGEINHVINGATDWVYEEELRTTQLLSWSPDAKHLAYGRFDESSIPEYGFQLFSEVNDIFAYVYKYPFAGENNSKVSIHLYDVDNKISKEVKLPVDKETYYPRLEFSPQGDLAVFTLNRHQNEFKLFSVHPTSLVPRLQLTEIDDAYVEEKWINSLRIEEKGFVMVSERNGYAQIFRIDANGVVTICLTPGQYDVTMLYGVDKKGNVYYQAADETPIARRVLKVSPRGKITVLAGDRGVNSALFSSDFSYCLNSCSNQETPTIYTVLKTQNNRYTRLLEDNAVLRKKLENYRFSPAEFTTIQTDNGLEFNAYFIKPSSFDPTKKYPVLMVQYSGPDSQQVLDSYSMSWTQYLAEQGYIIACVDGRGTGARGRQWKKCTYMKIGIYESDDQIAAARAISKLPYVDAKRVAIWGWSFGGYNTLLCLCRSEGVFKAGIAIAPVTDWSFYDTIYTERFLHTPQENPSGYREGAPLSLARNLSGNLLIIHGTADDNVHLRNTMTFIEELIQADIPFEMAIYPNRDHSISGGNTRLHFFKRQIDFLQRNL